MPATHNVRLKVDVLVARVLHEEALDDLVLEPTLRDVKGRRGLGSAVLGARDGGLVGLVQSHGVLLMRMKEHVRTPMTNRVDESVANPPRAALHRGESPFPPVPRPWSG